MQTMYDLVWMQAERSPDAIAMVDDRTDRNLSYRGLIDEIDAIAAGFAELGITAGSKVATCLPNVWEHGLVVLALQRLNAVPAMVNPRLKPADIAQLVESGGFAGAVILSDPELAAVVPADAPLLAVGGEAGVARDFTDCRADPAKLPPVPIPAPDETSAIFYTSGTTGLPKGVLIPHGATEHRVVWLSTQAGLRHGGELRTLGFMPIAHCIGFYGMFLVTLAYGGTYYVISAFDPAHAVDMIAKHEITYLFAAPTLFYALTKAPNYTPEKMHSLELCLYGGTAIDPDLIGHMADCWENTTVRHIYGTTETMCSGYNPNPVGDHAALRPGYYTRLRYIALGGGPDDIIGAGDEGELIVDASSDAIFSEYLNQPDATAEKIRNGWYYTGDVITVDERGYFTLHGRVDDMIRSGGESIHPDEVEAVLRTHGSVADCAVVGIADPKWGQMVVGCVVTQGDRIEIETPAAAAVLDAFFKESALAGFKRPRGYIFVDEIPRNPGNGNVLRRLLRDSAVSARASQNGFHMID